MFNRTYPLRSRRAGLLSAGEILERSELPIAGGDGISLSRKQCRAHLIRVMPGIACDHLSRISQAVKATSQMM